MTKVIHKANYNKQYSVYSVFGSIRVCTPMCDSKAVYDNAKNYHNHRLWSKVTCKKCLKIKEKLERENIKKGRSNEK